MKYKIGDKVHIISVWDWEEELTNRFLNKDFIVGDYTSVREGYILSGHPAYWFKEEMLESLKAIPQMKEI